MYIVLNDFSFSIDGIGFDKKDYLKFVEDKRLVSMLKDRLSKITLVILEEESYLEDDYLNEEGADCLDVKIQILPEETILDKINNKEFRYSEYNSEGRYAFYNNIFKELRSVAVGTSNFLLIRNIRFYSVSQNMAINIDDILGLSKEEK